MTMGKSSPGRFFPAACSRGTAERSTAFPGTGFPEGFLHRPRPEERPSFKKRRSKNGTGSPRARGEDAPGLIFPFPERVYLPSVQGFRITAAQTEALSCCGSSMSFTCSMMVPTSSRLEQSLAFWRARKEGSLSSSLQTCKPSEQASTASPGCRSRGMALMSTSSMAPP